MATALYRRYRPEAFSEMIGQAHVTEPLMTALRTSRIGHAYLFSGPRGCGKTTSARILARCLNCAEGPTDHPCGVCPSCVELSRDGGGSLDVVEIDAASHGGVDDARDLRERAVFAPARDRYKIFIIDEAHMVTAGGFNALLKIVEEPPPHVKFIFATTEPEKVIGTIRSRTHHYPFRLIAPGTLIDYVQTLCDSEGVSIAPGVLPLVVRAGGGSVRDTLSILDQLIAGSEGTNVTLERATGLLGFTSSELIDEVVIALGKNDAGVAFAATDRVVQTGQDPRRFVEDLLERLRDLIVISATTIEGASAVFRGVPDDQLQRMFEQSQLFAPGQLSRIADAVSNALNSMVGATAPRLHLELMIARALVLGGVVAAGNAAGAGAGAGAGAAASGAHSGLAVPTPTPTPIPAAPAASAQGAAAPVAPVAPVAAPSVAASQPAPSQSAAPPPATPQSSAAGASAPGIDVIAAMKSAREFLKSDAATAPRPPIVPLGGHASATRPAEAADSAAELPAQAVSDVAAQASSSGASVQRPSGKPAVTTQELIEIWPDLLEELLELDREAWNAVREVQPLELRDSELLVIGVSSDSDLDAFKASGAAPLREAIIGALGINVKYLPRPMPAGVRPIASSAAQRENGTEPPQEPSPTEQQPVGEPAPEHMPAPQYGSGASSEPEYEPVPAPDPEWAQEPDSEPGPFPEPEPARDPAPEPAPELGRAAVPEPGSEQGPAPDPDPRPAPDPDPDPHPDPDPDPHPDPDPDPDPVSGQGPAAESGAESGPVTDLKSATATEPSPIPEPEPVSKQQADPKPELAAEPVGFTRYGESVVREVLGARFIEERPIPEGFER